MHAYPIELTPDGDVYLVTCPDFPEVTSFGEDVADARINARDAIEEALAARIADRQAIPEPSTGSCWIRLPIQTGLKIELYRALRARGATKTDLARRLGWHRPQVDRLLDLNHTSSLDRLETAFAALGVELDVRVRAREEA
jgi:antitoxin HicB